MLGARTTSGAGERSQALNAEVPRFRTDRDRLEVIAVEGPQARRVAGPARRRDETFRLIDWHAPVSGPMHADRGDPERHQGNGRRR